MDDRLNAILIEPQLDRFRDLCDLHGEDLEARFSGWHRHAILSRDRVFLFPRHRQWVPGLRREALVLAGMAGRTAMVPELLGVWEDRAISPYPFMATSRLPGTVWSALEDAVSLDQVVTMLTSLGRAIAGWHAIDLGDFPSRFRRRTSGLREFEQDLDPGFLQRQAARAVTLLGLPEATVDRWMTMLAPLRRLSPVLVHGDLHEDQILVDASFGVTGILDWETASAGNPLKDFDFGEWGTGIFRWEADFAVMRRAMWDAYAAARGINLPSWRSMHLFFCLRDLPADDDGGDWSVMRRERILDVLEQIA